jgi:hypothetical protein
MNAAEQALVRTLAQEALARYCWGYDEGDFDLLGDSFTEGATTGGKVAHTEFGWGPMKGRQEIVDVLKGIRATQTDQRRHSIHTVRFVAQTEDSAEFWCYLHIASTQDKATRMLTAGWYHVKAAKAADGVWRMADLDALLDSPF